MNTTVLRIDHRRQLRELMAPVADRIRLARRRTLLPTAVLARLAGLRGATLRGIESGERAVGAAVIGRVARALAIDEEELYPEGRPDLFWARVGAQMRQECLHPVPAVTVELARAA